MSDAPPPQRRTWHEETAGLISDEERAASERTARWIRWVLVALGIWILIVFLAFVPGLF